MSKEKGLRRLLLLKSNFGDLEVHPIQTLYNNYHTKVFKLFSLDWRHTARLKMDLGIQWQKSFQNK